MDHFLIFKCQFIIFKKYISIVKNHLMYFDNQYLGSEEFGANFWIFSVERESLFNCSIFMCMNLQDQEFRTRTQ